MGRNSLVRRETHPSIHPRMPEVCFLLYPFFEGDHLIIVPWLPPASCPSACRRQASLHDQDTQLFCQLQGRNLPDTRSGGGQPGTNAPWSFTASIAFLLLMQPRKDTCQPRGAASAFVLAVMEVKSHVMFIDFEYSLCVHLI